MNSRALLAQILIVLAIAIGLLAFSNAAAASPIRPKLERVMTPTPEPVIPFSPARAGWNGPETKQTANPTLEALGPAGSARQARGALLAAFVPDLRLLALVALVILLLRRIRKMTRSTRSQDTQPALPPPQVIALRDSDDAGERRSRAA